MDTLDEKELPAPTPPPKSGVIDNGRGYVDRKSLSGSKHTNKEVGKKLNNMYNLLKHKQKDGRLKVHKRKQPTLDGKVLI